MKIKTLFFLTIGWIFSVPSHAVSFEVCYDFGCRNKERVILTPAEWRGVADWFKPAAKSAHEERNQIKKAIGWMEVVVGKHTPTHKDLGLDLENNINAPFPGQLDCIDESINTTNYLKLFTRFNYLRYHQVKERAYRRAIFDQHWSAQIVDLQTGKSWVVDSWFQANGYLPYVIAHEQWMDISPMNAIRDNSAYNKTDGSRPKGFWQRLLNRD
jgi:hypothetical protein